MHLLLPLLLQSLPKVNNHDGPVMLLHMGVDSKAKRFKLERQGGDSHPWALPQLVQISAVMSISTSKMWDVISYSHCVPVFNPSRCAYNEGSFRVPDVRGWQPQGTCIDECEALGSCHTTIVDVDSVAEELCVRGFDVEVSTDPGRYICNVRAPLACLPRVCSRAIAAHCMWTTPAVYHAGSHSTSRIPKNLWAGPWEHCPSLKTLHPTHRH